MFVHSLCKTCTIKIHDSSDDGVDDDGCDNVNDDGDRGEDGGDNDYAVTIEANDGGDDAMRITILVTLTVAVLIAML